MRKQMRKFLGCLLSIALVLSDIPIVAIAEETFQDVVSTTGDTSSLEELTESTQNKNPEILNEVTKLRKENAKYFRLSDGSIQVAEYDSPVHFFKDGIWVDYDNTLTEIDSEEANGKDLVNNVSDTNVRLSQKTNGKKFVRVEKDGHKLSWYYLNANKVTAQIKGDDKVSSSKLVLDKLTSTVIYSNVYENVDFEYLIVPSGLKENIILKSNKSQTVFESKYKSNGLIPEQIDEQTIILKSESGDTVYTVKAPFMEDADGAYSENVSLM